MRHARSFWVGLLAEVRAGASTADVARRHRVKVSTLRWWQWQLRGAETDRTPRLLPVIAELPAGPLRHVEIVLEGAALRVEEGTNVQYVAALAQALKSAC